MNEQSIECGHEKCICTVMAPVSHDGFCSDFCNDASTREEENACGCGHPQCDAT